MKKRKVKKDEFLGKNKVRFSFLKHGTSLFCK